MLFHLFKDVNWVSRAKNPSKTYSLVEYPRGLMRLTNQIEATPKMHKVNIKKKKKRRDRDTENRGLAHIIMCQPHISIKCVGKSVLHYYNHSNQEFEFNHCFKGVWLYHIIPKEDSTGT